MNDYLNIPRLKKGYAILLYENGSLVSICIYSQIHIPASENDLTLSYFNVLMKGASLNY